MIRFNHWGRGCRCQAKACAVSFAAHVSRVTIRSRPGHEMDSTAERDRSDRIALSSTPHHLFQVERCGEWSAPGRRRTSHSRFFQGAEPNRLIRRPRRVRYKHGDLFAPLSEIWAPPPIRAHLTEVASLELVGGSRRSSPVPTRRRRRLLSSNRTVVLGGNRAGEPDSIMAGFPSLPFQVSPTSLRPSPGNSGTKRGCLLARLRAAERRVGEMEEVVARVSSMW